MHANFGFIRDLDLDAWSVRSRRDETGATHPASISISLFGHPEPDAPRVTLTMDVDEAEQLSATLARLVADARQGNFSEPDHELTEFVASEDLRRAWSDLMAEDIDDIEDDETGGDASA